MENIKQIQSAALLSQTRIIQAAAQQPPPPKVLLKKLNLVTRGTETLEEYGQPDGTTEAQAEREQVYTLEDQLPQDPMDGRGIEDGEEKKEGEGVEGQIEGEGRQPVVEGEQPVVEEEQPMIQQMGVRIPPTTYEDPISFKKAEQQLI